MNGPSTRRGLDQLVNINMLTSRWVLQMYKQRTAGVKGKWMGQLSLLATPTGPQLSLLPRLTWLLITHFGGQGCP